MFDERCIFVQYDLPNTKTRKKICTYENICLSKRVYCLIYDGNMDPETCCMQFLVHLVYFGKDFEIL